MITTFQYQQLLARTEGNRLRSGTTPEPHTGPESELHEKILDYCRGRGWPAVHSRMDRPSTQQKGVCDFIIAADLGKTYWVEAKRKGEKPTTEQLGFIAWLKKNGHRAAIIWSYEEFLAVVNDQSERPAR